MSTIAEPPSVDSTATARPETTLSARPLPAGTAPIKPEYLIHQTPLVDSSSTSALNNLDTDDLAEGVTTSGSGDARDNKRRKPNKKERKGQNKARHFPVIRETNVKICKAWETTGSCERGESCKFAHSWDGYFDIKPKDVYLNFDGKLQDQPPYAEDKEDKGGEDIIGSRINLSTTCPVLKDLGYCPYGWRCRFLGGHVKKIQDQSGENGASTSSGPITRLGGWELLNLSTGEKEGSRWKHGETNWVDWDVINSLKRNEYDFPFSRAYLSKLEPEKPFTLSNSKPKYLKQPKNKRKAVSPMDEESAMNVSEEAAMNNEEDSLNKDGANVEKEKEDEKGHIVGESEVMDVPLRPEEKKRLNWEGGRYLAPLTTVGNLPFRRLCVDYGATITISEMALAQPLVSGHNDEWALCRRHESEKMFGVQLAGGFANRMVPAAELIKNTLHGGVDFVDINMGCPIDLVFNQGAGSALMDAPGRLAKMMVGMNRALGDIPLTVKFRTGVANGKPNAHKLIPRFATQWGAGALTLHGRSRQQRYSKLADWDYIKTCADTLRESLKDANLAPVPIFGNGDCFSAQGYYEEMEKSGVDGVMVARGALIKPWIFTEIKERREWDISATERLEGIRKYAEFGLSHWGSDTQGINTTRRFLCEALSFQCRYVPLGILERLPAKLNERPPAYRGRNELETLLSSPFSNDWVKISEMFLGKVDDGFNFIPKHKSNAYGNEEAQG
ncbi:tRNA-dihydrouridine(47) synthase [NAD(P)(+)] [Kwoniella mangroviensis CBS 10435]|uniref:tRNA-dihydrouridine(47) synthase [NAD(P)(+)] n=1 Tax=Kwoniella mangroviensis CBS 10435 TaxID=1331196 RepID=A0A1B9IHR0_9TREE|nr:tRNA-dihydrouridine(47) synthase [NAD(P)(+)] [Kwoniella mangroviensis CBS 10435]